MSQMECPRSTKCCESRIAGDRHEKKWDKKNRSHRTVPIVPKKKRAFNSGVISSGGMLFFRVYDREQFFR